MRVVLFLPTVLVWAVPFGTFCQTDSPRTSTSVFDLQTRLAPVALGTGLMYVPGTGIRLTASATSGIASFVGVDAPFPVNNVVPSWNLRKRKDNYGYIDVDTLKLDATWPRIEYRLTLYTNTMGVTPTLRLTSVCCADTATRIAYAPLPNPGVTTSLPVQWRSQYWVPEIGGVIRGPTSLSMAEHYYGCNLPTETVAADCYDSVRPVDVYATGHGLTEGRVVRVRGVLSVTGGTARLDSTPAFIRVLD